ncbi:MAG: hypothetical protein ACJAZ2_001658 [Glaciecola sp.]|jgi:hypothetical protein
MKRLISAFLFLLTTSISFAGNYDLIPKNGSSIWGSTSWYSGKKNVVSLRVDSAVIMGADTTNYLLKNVQPSTLENSSENCFDVFGASLIGHSYLVGGNKIQLQNYEGDTTEIDFSLNDGDSIICYSKGDTLVVLTLDSTFLGTVLGKADSIKTYSFRLQIGGVTSSSYLDTMQLKISKTNGATALFNMYYFPFSPSYFDDHGPEGSYGIFKATIKQQFVLEGVTTSSSKLGIQNLDYQAFYSGFEVGDEFHRSSSENCTCPNYSGSKTIDKIITKNNVNGTYSYTIDRTKNSWQGPNDPSNYTYSRDTVIFSPSDSVKLNRLPYETNSAVAEYSMEFSSQTDSTEKKFQGYLLLQDWDNPGTFCEATGSGPGSSTYNVCHLIPDSGYEGVGSWGSSNVVSYYKTKKCGEWGTRLVVSTQDIDRNPRLVLMPNPNFGTFVISSETLISSLKIYSQSGTIVKTITLSNTQNSIEVQLEKSGVYFVHVQSGNSTQVLKAVVLK